MTAFNQSTSEYTEALSTGLFHPISNADPDLGHGNASHTQGPTLLERLLGR